MKKLIFISFLLLVESSSFGQKIENISFDSLKGFWRLRDRCTYSISLTQNSIIVINLIKKNHKKMNVIPTFIGENNISYRKITRNDYLKNHVIRY